MRNAGEVDSICAFSRTLSFAFALKEREPWRWEYVHPSDLCLLSAYSELPSFVVCSSGRSRRCRTEYLLLKSQRRNVQGSQIAMTRLIAPGPDQCGGLKLFVELCRGIAERIDCTSDR